VVGGGLSRLDHIYSRVPEIWGAWVFSDHVTTRLVQASLATPAVCGAAWLARATLAVGNATLSSAA
jgi:fructokinase